MATKEARPLKRGLPPMHPGELLREDILPALKAEGVTKQAVAERLGVSRQQLDLIERGKNAVSPEMALRLGRLFDNSPEFWLNLQRNYDLARAREALGPALEAIQPMPRPQAA